MKRIFVLEDDEVTRFLYTKLFKDKYNTVITSTIDQAIIEIAKTKFDLYILDIILSDSIHTGIELTKFNISPILIVSSMDIIKSRMEHFTNIMRKPVKPNILIAKIESILNTV
jgi:DNA-binding response OmpR family regulator